VFCFVCFGAAELRLLGAVEIVFVFVVMLVGAGVGWDGG
jgi:hypothetical protein